MTTSTTCLQCGEPLIGYRRHARFCSPAHRAAYQRASIANKNPRVRFLRRRPCDRAAESAGYVSIVPDTRFPGMYRLKRTDGTLSDMVNITRAKDALASDRPSPA
jgi:hypothetical protein